MKKDKRLIENASPEIKWAWERNGNKFKLTGYMKGIRKITSVESLTADEVLTLEHINRKLDSLLRVWDGNNTLSKVNYLRRVERGISNGK